MKAVYGTNKFNGEGGISRTAKRIIIHPRFTPTIYRPSFTTYSYDLALIEVDEIEYRQVSEGGGEGRTSVIKLMRVNLLLAYVKRPFKSMKFTMFLSAFLTYFTTLKYHINLLSLK